jgi:hypothetical protein
MRLTDKILLILSMAAILRCNTQKPDGESNHSVDNVKADTHKLTENSRQTIVTDTLKMEHLKSIIGAFSITKTVLGHYKLLQNDTEDEAQLLRLMIGLCKEQNTDARLVQRIQKIHNDLIAYRKDKRKMLTLDQYDSTKKNCEEYVQMVFVNFPCFKKGDDGIYYYQSDVDR